VPKDVDSVIARNRRRFRGCFTKEIAGGNTGGSTVNVMVKVGEGGSVISSSSASTTASAALTQCVVASFYSMKFAEPDGGTSQFNVPVVAQREVESGRSLSSRPADGKFRVCLAIPSEA